MRQARCPDKGLAHSCGPACAGDRVAWPSGLLRPQSCGCSPPALPNGPPLRGHREPVPSPGASGGPRLARAGSQSHDPSAGPPSLSGASAPTAPGPVLTDPWLRRYAHKPHLRVRVQMAYHIALSDPALRPSEQHDLVCRLLLEKKKKSSVLATSVSTS